MTDGDHVAKGAAGERGWGSFRPGPSPSASRAGIREIAPELLVGLPVLAVFGLWIAYQAGYPPTVWYPGAILILVLAGTVVGVFPGVLRDVPRSTVVAVAALGGFAAWSFASIAWAEVKGDAWDGANRILFYAIVYALFAVWPWRPRVAAGLLGVQVAVTAGVVGAFFARAVASDDPGSYFTGGRLAEPAGYINANCAAALMAFWPALFLSSRREVPWFLRGLFMAAAGLLLEIALLTQSRGALFSVPIVLVAYVALVPGRVRSLLMLAPIAVVVWFTLDPVLDVYSASTETRAAALDDAAPVMLTSVLLLLLIGTVLGLADRALNLSDRTAGRLRRGMGGAAFVAAAASVVALLVVYGNPISRGQDAWDEFKAGQTAEFGASHFSGLGSNRYDFWRVAMGEFADAPITGMGADNFAVAYLRERESDEEPLYPHSLPVMVASQTGIVGTLLFVTFLGSALVAAWRTRSRSSAFGWAVAATAVVTASYFFVHGAVDWFWEFAGLGGPAIAWLGLAAGLGRSRPASLQADRRAGWHRRLVLAAAAAVAVAAASSFVFPWLAARGVDNALRTWRADPAAAFADLDAARRLNPLSDRADRVAGVIAGRVGDWPRLRLAFERALERNPSGWYAQLQLALLDAQEGRREDALERLAVARSLNPLEPVLADVEERVRRGEAVPFDVVNETFVQRVEARTS